MREVADCQKLPNLQVDRTMERLDNSCIRFAIAQGTRSMAINFRGKIGPIGQPTFICRAGVPKRIRMSGMGELTA